MVTKSYNFGPRIIILFCGILLFFSTPIWGQPTVEEKIAQIAEQEAKYDLFSGSVLVAKDGEIIYARGFGEANKEYHIENSLETRYNISSIQKAFIATATMLLYREGKLDLEDPLTKYYPECPFQTADQIKIKHLLNHTNGLGDYRDNEEYQRNSEKYTCIDDVLPLVFALEPEFAPGERFKYSNAGVLLLKAVIERATGHKLKEVLQQRIFKPLNMHNTTMYVGGDLLENRASAYTLSDDGKSYKRVTGEPSAYAGGGIYTTVLDLLKFDQALYSDKLLDKKCKDIMFTPVEASPNYAYGWIVVEFGGTSVIYHSGGSGGFNSEFRRYPDMGYTIIVLSNYPGAAFELANKIDCMLLGLPYKVATEADKHYRLGMHLQEYGKHELAIKEFESNIGGIQPHLPSVYQAARTRILGEFEQENAISLLDQYIALADESTRPSIAAAWWRKGVACEQLGDIEKARQNYEKSLELDEGFDLAKEALDKLNAGE